MLVRFNFYPSDKELISLMTLQKSRTESLRSIAARHSEIPLEPRSHSTPRNKKSLVDSWRRLAVRIIASVVFAGLSGSESVGFGISLTFNDIRLDEVSEFTAQYIHQLSMKNNNKNFRLSGVQFPLQNKIKYCDTSINLTRIGLCSADNYECLYVVECTGNGSTMAPLIFKAGGSVGGDSGQSLGISGLILSFPVNKESSMSILFSSDSIVLNYNKQH